MALRGVRALEDRGRKVGWPYETYSDKVAFDSWSRRLSRILYGPIKTEHFVFNGSLCGRSRTGSPLRRGRRRVSRQSDEGGREAAAEAQVKVSRVIAQASSYERKHGEARS